MEDGLTVIIKFAEKLEKYFQDFKPASIFPNPNNSYFIQEALEDYRKKEIQDIKFNKASKLIKSLFYLGGQWITHPAYTGDELMAFVQHNESKPWKSNNYLPYLSWETKTRCGKRVCMANTSPEPDLCNMLTSFYDDMAQCKTDDIHANTWINDTHLNKVGKSSSVSLTV